MSIGDLKIYGGSSNPELVSEICSHLGISPGVITLYRDKIEQKRIKIGDNARGTDVFIIQSGSPDPDSCLMELFLMVDTFKRASARRITAVMPYCPYSIYHGIREPRTPRASKMLADILHRVGSSRALFMELRDEQIAGHYDIPVDQLISSPIFVPYIRERFRSCSGQLTIVNTDDKLKLAETYAEKYLKGLNANYASISLKGGGKIIGDVSGKCAILLDDSVITGETITESARILIASGAVEVHAIATHCLLMPGSIEKINNSHLSSLITTDTIEHSTADLGEKIIKLKTGKRFAAAILNVHNEDSIKALNEVVE